MKQFAPTILARKYIAKQMGVLPKEIIFTSALIVII